MPDAGLLKILLVSNHRRFKIHFRAYPWARELAARGHQVDVMCHADTERWRTRIEQVQGFRIIHSPDLMVGALRQGWDPVCALRRGNFLFQEVNGYDIIHALDTRPAVILPALAYARRHGITIVSDWIDWWGRGGLIAERRPWWYRHAFGWFETYFEEAFRARLDGLTAISSSLIDRAVRLGVDPGRCLQIPGGANLEAFQGALSREEARSQLGLSQSAPVFCFSGLDVLTDLPLAAAAFERILETRPDAQLLLVGPGPEHRARLFPSPAAAKQVVATGPVPYADLKRYLPAADVFLMPYASRISNIGRWPNKLGDYFCIGRPTVSNPVGEVKAVFEQFDVGELADEDPASMAAAALRLAGDPARAGKLGENARRAAEDNFSWSRLVGQLERWYRFVLSVSRADQRAPVRPLPAA